MDDDDIKLHIKPGVFTIKSKLNEINPSYEGLHSEDSISLSYLEEEIEEEGSISNNSSSLSSIPSKYEKKENKNIPKKKSSNLSLKEVPYTFTWDEGGKDIKVTGTFVKWTKFYEMKYSQKEKRFKCIIRLPREKHEYKFIVDGVWKYSKKQPIKKDDKNNTNNFIDLTNYVPPNNKSKKSINEVKEEKVKIKEKKIKKKKKIIKKKKDRGYGLIFPNKDMLNSEAPVVQQDYMETFFIDSHSNQNIIGRSKYFNYKTNEPFTEEKSYKELMFGPHININHSLKCVGRKNLLEMGINFRFRDKNCTLVYYSHFPKEEEKNK